MTVLLVEVIATAIFGGGEAIGQVWLSIVAPIVGAIIAGILARPLFANRSAN